jgi:VanZ family protein
VLKKLLLPAAIIYTIALVFVSLISLHGIPSLGSSFDDKIYHFLAYFILAGLWITYYKPTKKKQTLLLVFIALLLFGILLESVQHQLNPNRTFDLNDMLANCIGILVGTLIVARFNIIKLK